MGFLTAAFNLVILTVLFTVIQSQEYIRTKRRMYAMCPPTFQRIGSECYTISDQPASWLEAHFYCKDKNSKLAEPNKNSDRKLRAFFQRMDHDTDEIWIGATYDNSTNIWQWSISGKNLSYDAFSRVEPKANNSMYYHCAVFNPSLKYRWSARSCVDRHRYICQHKMPKVSKKNRFKVYNRWNQTFPNQLANEVEMEVIDTKSKDGKRTNRRLRPIDSSENYPMPPKRLTVPPTETNNDIHVQFIPNYLTNEINPDVSYRTPSPAKEYPLTMEFIPAVIDLDNSNVQAAQAYMDTTTKRPRNPTNATSLDNETVNPIKPRKNPQSKRVKTKFDELLEEKRRIERNQKKVIRRRRKQEHARLLREKKQEDERKKQEEERKRLEDERKRQEEERNQKEEERKKQEQHAIDQLKLKQAEEAKQEEAALLERQKIEAQLNISKKEQERQEAEAKILKEQREEEEEHIRKQRLHEQNRLQLEYEERLKQQQTERERRLEEEKRISEENRRRVEQEEAARKEELKRLQEEDEKRLELQRMEIERKRQEKELARLEEENQKRIAAQKAREEEIRRREEALIAQLAEEKRLQEELRIKEETELSIYQQDLQSDINEKKRKEEAEKLEIERKEELLRIKKEKFKERLAKEAKKLEEQQQLKEAAKLEKQKQHREKIRKYAERISKLTPEMQAIYFKMRKERQRQKENNEASIPERK